MAKTRTPKIRAEAKAIAKLEASAKATYARKKTITEVIPPDVSRAKAGAWLDLISPITEWAGLRGDALRYQRQQLRIQQEESLFLVAKSVRRKLEGATALQPVANKVLVPALEKASLENPADDTMIELWANLLASAASGRNVEPRYVAIVEELGGSQARCLEILARHRADVVAYPYTFLTSARYNVIEHHVRAEIEMLLDPYSGKVADLTEEEQKELETQIQKWLSEFDGPGAYMEMFLIGNIEHNNVMIGEGLDLGERDLEILQSLGLLRRVDLQLHFPMAPRHFIYGSANYCYITGLGVDFLNACAPDMIKDFKIRENAERSRNDMKSI